MADNESLEKPSQAIQGKVQKMQDRTLLGRIENLKRCILFDGSSSMLDILPDGTNRYEVVKKVHREHLQSLEMRMFNFNDGFEEIKHGVVSETEDYHGNKVKNDSEIPFPCGGTNMTDAFLKLKDMGVKKCIIVTDGQPNNAETALEASKGIQFDVVYIGEPPIPDFLLKLGNISGNSFQRVDMLSTGSFKIKELGDKITKLLGTGGKK